MASKLNSMRLLEAQRVTYETCYYDPDQAPDAVAVARLIGVPPHHLYKTLVVEGASHGRPLLVMIAANTQLDLKRLAASIGQKRLSMATHATAERLTGLKVGGIGALALTAKHWPVYLDRPALELEAIYVSAGQRGVNLRVGVADLVRVLSVTAVDATV